MSALHAAPDTKVGRGFDATFGSQDFRHCVDAVYHNIQLRDAETGTVRGPLSKAVTSAAVRFLCWQYKPQV